MPKARCRLNPTKKGRRSAPSVSRSPAQCCGLDGQTSQGFAVFVGGFLRDVGGHCWGGWLFVPAGGLQPVTYKLLVEAWRVCAFCIAVRRPETAGVRGQGVGPLGAG